MNDTTQAQINQCRPVCVHLMCRRRCGCRCRCRGRCGREWGRGRPADQRRSLQRQRQPTCHWPWRAEPNKRGPLLHQHDGSHVGTGRAHTGLQTDTAPVFVHVCGGCSSMRVLTTPQTFNVELSLPKSQVDFLCCKCTHTTQHTHPPQQPTLVPLCVCVCVCVKLVAAMR